MTEFHGQLTMNVEGENSYHRGNLSKSIGKVRWQLRDDSKINQNTWPIEEGDHLEVYDNMGRLALSKYIIEDYDSHYHTGLKKQIVHGTTVEWLPYGVDAGFWFTIFNNRYRAKLVKKTDEE